MQRCPDPTCSHPNRPGARFCQSCGQLLDATAGAGPGWSPLPGGHLMRGGAYRILEPLGKGGMGALYLAADTGAFDRKCVVKELLDYYDPGDPEQARSAQARFETEARLLAELKHPGIPRIYSYFSEGGRHYIVMEYIEGETLERAVTHVDALGRRAAARPLSQEEVVRHAIRVCRVLEYLVAQRTPVIHHDVKPANLIVDRTSGEARLVDFGTAQVRTPWAAQARQGQRATSLYGTQGYAAPEQFQGSSEPRSDVYALAATVYHLLTDDDPGDHPFQFPKLSSLPEALGDALSRALRPEAQRRSTALEFRQALEAWLIPEDRAEPFVFRNGASARTSLDLAALCDRNWAEARQHLKDGDFDRWFASRNRHDLVAKARSARLDADIDAALESFLRRLNPRLGLPRLTVAPQTLSLGRVSRRSVVRKELRVSNQGRGYGQASFSSSVPWLEIDPPHVGCRAGNDVLASVRLKADSLPLRREQQAVIACVPERGARMAVAVSVELSLAAEIAQQALALVRVFAGWILSGVRWGVGIWSRAFRSLLRTRYGAWALVGEMVLLDLVLVALWWHVGARPVELARLALTAVRALPVALLAVYLLPALVLSAAGVMRELARALSRRTP